MNRLLKFSPILQMSGRSGADFVERITVWTAQGEFLRIIGKHFSHTGPVAQRDMLHLQPEILPFADGYALVEGLPEPAPGGFSLIEAGQVQGGSIRKHPFVRIEYTDRLMGAVVHEEGLDLVAGGEMRHKQRQHKPFRFNCGVINPAVQTGKTDKLNQMPDLISQTQRECIHLSNAIGREAVDDSGCNGTGRRCRRGFRPKKPSTLFHKPPDP